MHGWGALYGAIVAGSFSVPVSFFVRSPLIAATIVGAIWTIYFAAQIHGWHRYYFVVKPAQAALAEASARAAEARAKHEQVVAENKIKSERLQTALADYQEASTEGKAALDALFAQAVTSADKKRVLGAWQDFLKVQKKFEEEPDLAARMRMQAAAMRRETQHIRSIRLSF